MCLKGLEKSFLFITNFLISLLSIVCFGLAIWILADEPSFLKLLEISGASDFPVYRSGAILLLVVSIISFIVSCLGCCGVSNDNKCLMLVYVTMLFIVLVLMLTGIILAFKTDFKSIKEPLFKSMEKYDPDSNSNTDEEIVKAWDEFQLEFECCGVEFWTDWMKYNPNFGNEEIQERPRSGSEDDDRSSRRRNSKKSDDDDEDIVKERHWATHWSDDEKKPKVPESCCDPSKDQYECSLTPTTTNGNFHVGCFDRVVGFVERHSGAIGGVSVAVLVVMVMNFFFGLHLCTSRDFGERRRGNYR